MFPLPFACYQIMFPYDNVSNVCFQYTLSHVHFILPRVTLNSALVDKRIHHDLNILLAADCDFAKFHAGLALAVLVHDDQLKPQIEFTNPLPELFLRNYLSYDQAEAFREKYCRRYAFGIKNEILERINPLLRCDDGTVQGRFHFRWLNCGIFEFFIFDRITISIYLYCNLLK